MDWDFYNARMKQLQHPNERQYIGMHDLLDEHIHNTRLLGLEIEPIQIRFVMDYPQNKLMDLKTMQKYNLDELDPVYVSLLNRQETLSNLNVEILDALTPTIQDKPVIHTKIDKSHSRDLLNAIFFNEMLLVTRVEDYLKKSGALIGVDKDAIIHAVHSHAFDYEYQSPMEEIVQLTLGRSGFDG